MKYLLLLLPMTVLANGSIHHNAPKVYNETPKVYKTEVNLYKSEALAALAAMGNIPEISHKKKHGHSGVGFGYGAYNGKQGAAVGLTHHCDNTAFKFSAGMSGGESVLGAGVSFSF